MKKYVKIGAVIAGLAAVGAVICYVAMKIKDGREMETLYDCDEYNEEFIFEDEMAEEK